MILKGEFTIYNIKEVHQQILQEQKETPNLTEVRIESVERFDCTFCQLIMVLNKEENIKLSIADNVFMEEITKLGWNLGHE